MPTEVSSDRIITVNLRRRRLSQAAAAIIAAIILAAATIWANRRISDPGADFRKEIAEQRRYIAALLESERQKNAAIEELKRQLAEMRKQQGTDAGKHSTDEPPVVRSSATEGPSLHPAMPSLPAPQSENTSKAPPQRTAKVQTETTLQNVFASGLEFEKPSCSKRAGTVRCNFRVVNRQEEPQEFEIEITNISRSSWYSYLVDANGLKYYANDAQIAGVQMHIWEHERLDPEVPVIATVIFPASSPPKPPLAMSLSVRIKRSDSPQIGAPEAVFFKNISLD